MVVTAVCLSMFCSPAFAAEFPDVAPNAAYAEAVNALSEMGIIAGDDKGNFNPNNTITRAETAAIICRLLDVTDEAAKLRNAPFDDVPPDHWAAGCIAKAAAMGIVNGYGNGNFGTNDAVTYEQVITMLLRAWGYNPVVQEYGGYLQVADECGLTTAMNIGNTTPCSRSTMAVLCYRILNVAPYDYVIEE